MNYNLFLNEIELENLIQTLEKDNIDIVNTINNIVLELNKLDNTKWKSEEKQRIDDEFITYVKEVSNLVFIDLNSSIDLLKEALKVYKEKNDILTKEANELPSVG